MKQAVLISHDIGGFRLGFAYLSKTYESVMCFVQGPSLLEAKRNSANILYSLDEINIFNYDIYVSTGWATSFEKRCMKFLHASESEWIAILDHWNDYSERFVFEGKSFLPNQIIVFDKYAYQLSKSTFSNIECKLKTNTFDLEFTRSYQSLEIKKRNFIEFDLFLADPISEHHGDRFEYDEFDHIHFILRKLSDRYSPSHLLCIRPHPSEDYNKYEKFITKHNLRNISVSRRTLLEDLYLANFVFGDSSYAMHLAILVGKSVFCSIPLATVNSALPHASLKYLRELNV